jgi:hypothetical protein
LRQPSARIEKKVVYRLAFNGSLRSKWAGGKAVRAGLAVGGRIPPHFTLSPIWSRPYQNGAGRSQRETQPQAHFQRNPSGRGWLAVFPRCSLDPYESRYGRFTASPARTALKNSQLTCGDIVIISETVH